MLGLPSLLSPQGHSVERPEADEVENVRHEGALDAPIKRARAKKAVCACVCRARRVGCVFFCARRPGQTRQPIVSKNGTEMVLGSTGGTEWAEIVPEAAEVFDHLFVDRGVAR